MSLAERVIESLAEERPLTGRDRRAMRTHPGIVDDRRRVQTKCEGCGCSFLIAPKTMRDRRAAGKPMICPHCKQAKRVPVTDSMRAAWKAAFTDREIVEIAEGIWGPRAEWGDEWTLPAA